MQFRLSSKGLLLPVLIALFSLAHGLSAGAAQSFERESSITTKFMPVNAPRACRLGLTVTSGFEGYNVARLGIGSYLNWGMSATPVTPNGIDFIQVVRVKDDAFDEQLSKIPDVARARPGSYWLVGNEPDTAYGAEWGGQDNVSPETYAERYFAAYSAIKASDPTASVGIGGITQPTPARLEYLNRVLAAHKNRYGSLPPADFWHIHAFLLNEVPGEWGAGMPPDAAGNPYTSAPEVIDPEQSDSLVLFKKRITAFRTWMAQNDQRSKGLWITEFGVLMPSDPGLGLYDISIRRTRNFLQQSFYYLNTATDRKLGVASDGNRLVQRWYWWTLSADARQIGGGLYDVRPGQPAKSTILYDAFASFGRSYGCWNPAPQKSR